MSEAANATNGANSANGKRQAGNVNGARPKITQDHKRDQRSEDSRETQFTPAMPVGVFDTGVGGLTILQELLRELPGERYVYFGDTGNCPYGVRAEEEIQSLSRSAARHLLDRGVKMIVVACNTASVSALANLRATFSDAAPYIHFVGVVPAVKPAAERTRVGRVGVASTEASAKGGYLKRLIAEHATGVEVLAVGCPRLVELVEAGTLDGHVAEAAVRGYIQPLLDAGIDKLVLGLYAFPGAARGVRARRRPQRRADRLGFGHRTADSAHARRKAVAREQGGGSRGAASAQRPRRVLVQR